MLIKTCFALIKSKWSILSFYFVILFVAVVFGMIAFVPIKIAVKDGVDNFFIPVLLSIAVIVFGGYLIHTMFRLAPRIEIDYDTVTLRYLFKTISFRVTDIKTIGYNGRRPYKMIVTSYLEGAKITLLDGTAYYIYDDLYRNIAAVKQCLQQVKEGISAVSITTDKEADTSLVKYYKGIWSLTLRGMSALAFFVMMIIVLIIGLNRGSSGSLYYLLFMFFGVSLFNAYLLYFVGLSDKYLIICNHIFFWVKKRFRLEDIKIVVFDTQSKAPYAIRVITKDFHNRRFYCASLSEKQWLQLKADLEAKGVSVRNHLNL